jgi:hypothetical protein
MRNLLLLLLLVVGSSTFVHAQYFGARVGGLATNASIDFDNAEVDVDGKTNLMLGVFADFPLGTNLISIQPEINYLNRGYEIDANVGNLVAYEQSVAYIDLGAIVKLNFGRDNPLGFYVGAGPFVSYAVSGTRTDIAGERDIDFDADRIKRGGVQVAGIGGVTFGSDFKFFAELRYNATVTNTSDVDNLDVKQNFIGLSGGVMVPL